MSAETDWPGRILSPTLYLESEDKPDCGIDRVAIEVAVSQSIIDLREHEPGVSLKLRCKSSIDGE